MLPAEFQTYPMLAASQIKTFAERLTEGYRFELNEKIRNTGIRSVYYYKSDNSLLVTHVWTNRVHLLNLDTGHLRWFDHHGTTVRSVQVCNNEIITSSWDGTVCITDYDTLILRLILTENEMARCPYAAISPDNNFAFSYSYDSDKNPLLTSNTVRKWSLANGRLEKKLRLPGNHLSGRRCGACEVVDSKLFVVSDTGHLDIYDYLTGNMIAEFNYYDQLQTLCVLKNLKMVAIAGGEGDIYLCGNTGRQILRKRKAHQKDISQLMVLPGNPKIMVSVCFDGELKMWRLPDMELLELVKVSEDRLWTVTTVNDLLLAGGEDGIIWIYDIKKIPGAEPKGTLAFSDEAFSLFQPESNSFFANDKSMIQVVRNDDGKNVEAQFAEYLINSVCNFQIFMDLFGSERNNSSISINDNRGLYQITQ